MQIAAAIARVVEAGRNPEILPTDPWWDTTWAGAFDFTRSLGESQNKPFGSRAGKAPEELSWDFEDGASGRLLLLATGLGVNLATRPYRDYLTPLQEAWCRLERAGAPHASLDDLTDPADLQLARELEALYHLGTHRQHTIVLKLMHFAAEAQRRTVHPFLASAAARCIRDHLHMLEVPE